MYKLANILQLIDELRFDKENNHNKISYMQEEKLDENIRQLEIKFRILTEEQKTTDWNNGKNYYACGDTTDKIFLLSEQEATMSDYGFAEYNVYVGDSNNTKTSTRIRVTTDYAKATRVSQASEASSGGMWWLRSPCYSFDYDALSINGYGNAYSGGSVVATYGGVVPALSISLQ